MTKHPVPEKYLSMWKVMAKALENAQEWFDEAIARRDQGKIRVYSKMLADRTSALGNLQRIIWGPMLESLAHRPGQAFNRVRTSVTLDPPEMIVYDSEEEYFAALQASMKEAAEEGRGVIDAHVDTQAPIKPIHPEAD